MRSVLLLCLMVWAGAAPAAAGDLHELWDRQCGGCHGHAGVFARAQLRLDGRTLRSRTGDRLVADFLTRHNGGYSADHIAAIQDMLRAQLRVDPAFRRVCGDCHDTGAQLVRDYLVRRDGDLVLRSTGRSLASFLQRHGGVDADAAQTVIQALTRIEAEIHHP